MRAIARTAIGTKWIETAKPSVQSGEVLVRVDLVGLCRTDLAVADGRLPVQTPRVLGHEFVGRVQEVGLDVDRVVVGDRVSANPVVACSQCHRCRSGWPEACERGEFLGVDRDGALAEFVTLPASNVYVVPTQLDDRVAALLEPVAACAAVLKVPLERSGSGIVVGDGRLARMTTQILQSAGFENVRQVTTDTTQTPTDCADFVIETEGTDLSLGRCFDWLRPGGKLVLKSRPLSPLALDLRKVLSKEPKLFAVNYLPFDEAVALLSNPSIDYASIVGKTWPADQFQEAFDEAGRNEQQKQYIVICAES